MDGTEINEKSKSLIEELYNNKELDFDKASKLLGDFRVLTREKTLGSEVIDERCMTMLVDYSYKCHTEAQKCLSNLILNYAHLRDGLVDPYVCCIESRLKGILNENEATDDMKKISDSKQIGELLYYDLRIIFLLSAICPSSRVRIRDRLSDMILKVTCNEAEKFDHQNNLLVIESLKTLFNLTLDKCINVNLAAEVIKKLFAIVGTDNDIVNNAEDGTRLDVTDQLLVNLIHLLTNMPEQVYLKLSDEDCNKVLAHLDEQLKTFSKSSFRDTVLPVLNVCANICKHNDTIRQNWFDQIIGSVKDFDKRPEEYETLRGRIVRLMTSVDVHIKDIAAEFLYALCGSDTEKFITYTGFGNSAAFLSTRGLLNAQGLKESHEEQVIPDTDRHYHELRTKIDPITGKLEVTKRNPMEGLSEEEKEWHAHELAGAITKLTNLGVVKPMGIDEKGCISELRPRDHDTTRDEDRKMESDSE